MVKTVTMTVVWYEDPTEEEKNSEEFQVNGENGFALVKIAGNDDVVELKLEPGDADALVNLFNGAFGMAQDVSDLE